LRSGCAGRTLWAARPRGPGPTGAEQEERCPTRTSSTASARCRGADEPSGGLLASCYRNALRLAEEHRLESVAFPAISTGAFGFPVRPAAEVALGTVLDGAAGLRHVRLVRFVLRTAETWRSTGTS
jgi:O-acetyl-ADP-ribose deacetylase (regulator of RNase III)